LEGGGGWPDASSSVQAVIDIYGPTDMTAENFRSIEPVVKFLGKPFDEMKEQYRKASPIQYVTKDAPPTLIFHGSIDSIVPIDQAESLAKKLKELGAPFFYDRQEGWDHGMDLFREVSPRCIYIEDRFLDKVLPLPKRGEKQNGTLEGIPGAVHAHSN
jgi:acetyl esterase/lipase